MVYNPGYRSGVPTRILAQVTQNHTLELSFLAHFPKIAGVFLALILTLELFFFWRARVGEHAHKYTHVHAHHKGRVHHNYSDALRSLVCCRTYFTNSSHIAEPYVLGTWNDLPTRGTCSLSRDQVAILYWMTVSKPHFAPFHCP